MKRMCTESTPILIDNEYENNTEPRLSSDSENSSKDSVSQLSIGPEECVICLDPIELDSAYSFDCGHQLHVECFHRYFLYNYDYERNYISCPVCRQEVRLNMINDGARNDSWIEHVLSCMKVLSVFTITTTSMYLVLEYLD